MPECHVERALRAPADDVWRFLLEPGRWPAVIGAVRSVERTAFDGIDAVTEWEVEVGRGVLWWRGREHYDADARRMTFEAVDGDLDELSGTWDIAERAPGCQLTLAMRFDVGIPALARRIDPVAERVVTATLGEIADHIDRALAATVEVADAVG